MPRKSDNIPINNELLDRRVKLTKDDKELIVYLREEDGISYQKLANQFNVSKRTIIFICKPETLIASNEARKKRGGSMIYYDKKTHAITTKEHREYKKELFDKGLIKMTQEKVMITRIKAPKFRVGRCILNEYELRQLQLEVAKGLKPSGMVVKSCQNGIACVMLENGMFDRGFGQNGGYDIGSAISIEHYKLRFNKDLIKNV
jgi:transposase-like protein